MVLYQGCGAHYYNILPSIYHYPASGSTENKTEPVQLQPGDVAEPEVTVSGNAPEPTLAEQDPQAQASLSGSTSTDAHEEL